MKAPVEISKALRDIPIIPLMEPLKSTEIGDPAESQFGEHFLLQKDEPVGFREEYTKPGRDGKHQGPIWSTPKRRMPRLKKVSRVYAGRKNWETYQKATIRAPATRSAGTDQIHSKISAGSGKTSTTSGDAGGTHSRCVPFHDIITVSVASGGNRKIHPEECSLDDSKAIGSSHILDMIQYENSVSNSSGASDCSDESQPFEKAFDDLMSYVGSNVSGLNDLLDVMSDHEDLEDGHNDDLDSDMGSYDPGGIASKDNIYFDTNAPQGISRTQSGLRSLRHYKKPCFVSRSLSSSRSFPLNRLRSISRNSSVKQTGSFDVCAVASVCPTQSTSWSPRQLLRSMSMSPKRDQLSSQEGTLFPMQDWPDKDIPSETKTRIACDSKSRPRIASDSFNKAGLGISESGNPASDSSVSSTSTTGTHPWETALDHLLSHIEALNTSKADSSGATRRSAAESNALKPQSEEQCLTPKLHGVPKSSVAPLSASSEESKPSTLLPMFPAGSTTPKRPNHPNKPSVTPLRCLGGRITLDECKGTSCDEHFEIERAKAGKTGTSLMCLDEQTDDISRRKWDRADPALGRTLSWCAKQEQSEQSEEEVELTLENFITGYNSSGLQAPSTFLVAALKHERVAGPFEDIELTLEGNILEVVSPLQTFHIEQPAHSGEDIELTLNGNIMCNPNRSASFASSASENSETCHWPSDTQSDDGSDANTPPNTTTLSYSPRYHGSSECIDDWKHISRRSKGKRRSLSSMFFKKSFVSMRSESKKEATRPRSATPWPRSPRASGRTAAIVYG